jgi:hypothetical protein
MVCINNGIYIYIYKYIFWFPYYIDVFYVEWKKLFVSRKLMSFNNAK